MPVAPKLRHAIAGALTSACIAWVGAVAVDAPAADAASDGPEPSLEIVQQGSSRYAIVLGGSASPSERSAATEFTCICTRIPPRDT